MLILKKGIILTLILSFSTITNSQSIIDSLSSKLFSIDNNNDKGKLMFEIGKAYKSINQDSSISYFRKANHIFEKDSAFSTFRANALMELGIYYKPVNFDSALNYLNKAYIISNECDFKFGMAESLLYIGMTQYNKSKDSLCIKNILDASTIYKEIDDLKGTFDCYNSLASIFINFNNAEKAIYFSNKAHKLATYENDSLLIAQALYHRGILSSRLSKYSDALSDLFEATELYEKLNKAKNCARLYIEIGEVYSSINNYKKAIEYHQKAISYFKQHTELWEYGNAAIQLGGSFLNDNIYLDSALHYTLIGQAVMEEFGDVYSMAGNNINLGNIEKNRKNYTKAIEHYETALKFMLENQQIYYVSVIYRNIGNTYQLLNKHIRAISHYQESIKYAKQIKSELNLYQAYEKISESYKELHAYKKSLEYLTLGMQIKDTISKKENREIILNLETKYQTAQKENEISRLNEVNLENELIIQKDKLQQTRTYFLLLFISLLAITTILILIYRSQKRKRRAKEHEQELIKEAKIEIEQIIKDKNDELIKTLDKEMKNISQEIHDGILSDLTGIQFLIKNQEKNLDSQKMNNASKYLKKSIDKLRNISHQLNTPEFEFNTLEIAIEGYIEQYKDSNIDIGFNYQLKNNMDEIMQINIYRIIQEGVKNIFKHSNATRCNIDIEEKDKCIQLLIKDNGSGDEGNKKGIGLSNIKERVNHMKGFVQLNTKAGFEINIKLPLIG